MEEVVICSLLLTVLSPTCTLVYAGSSSRAAKRSLAMRACMPTMVWVLPAVRGGVRGGGVRGVEDRRGVR